MIGRPLRSVPKNSVRRAEASACAARSSPISASLSPGSANTCAASGTISLSSKGMTSSGAEGSRAEVESLARNTIHNTSAPTRTSPHRRKFTAPHDVGFTRVSGRFEGASGRRALLERSPSTAARRRRGPASRNERAAFGGVVGCDRVRSWRGAGLRPASRCDPGLQCARCLQTLPSWTAAFPRLVVSA